MTKSEGLRAVSEWEAERVLLSRGWTKERCPQCKGVGHFPHNQPDSDSLPFSVANHHWGRACEDCEGQGWKWQAPSVREISP